MFPRGERSRFCRHIALFCLAGSSLANMNACTNGTAEYTRQVLAWSRNVTSRSTDAEFWISRFVGDDTRKGSVNADKDQDCESDLLAFSVELQLRAKLCLYVGDANHSFAAKRNVVAALRSAAELIDGEVILLDIGDGSIGTLTKGRAGADWSDTLYPLLTRLQASSATLDLVVVEQEGADAPWLADLLDTLADCCLTIRSVIMTIGAFSQQPVCTETWKESRSKSKWGARVPSQDFEVVTLPGCRSRISLLKLESQPTRIERSSDWPASERLTSVQFVPNRCDRHVERPDGSRVRVCSDPALSLPPWLLLRGSNVSCGCVALGTEQNHDGAGTEAVSFWWEMGFSVPRTERRDLHVDYRLDLLVDGERVGTGHDFSASEKEKIQLASFVHGVLHVPAPLLSWADDVRTMQLALVEIRARRELPAIASRRFSLQRTRADGGTKWMVCDTLEPAGGASEYPEILLDDRTLPPGPELRLMGACLPPSALQRGFLLQVVDLVEYAAQEVSAANVEMAGVSIRASAVQHRETWRVTWPSEKGLPSPGEHKVRMELVDKRGAVVAAASGAVCVAADGPTEEPFLARMGRQEGLGARACRDCLFHWVRFASHVCAACFNNPFAEWMPPSFNENLLRFAVAKTAVGTGPSDCHGLTAMMLVRMAKARRVLELGCFYGDSALFLLLGVAALDGDRWLHSVDVNPCPFVPPRSLRHLWRFSASDALGFLAGVDPDVVFDLVHVDDFHNAQHVLAELRALAPHLHRESVIIMHDTMAATRPLYNYGRADLPSDALKQLSPAEWEYTTFPTCHGLTVLRPASTAEAVRRSEPTAP